MNKRDCLGLWIVFASIYGGYAPADEHLTPSTTTTTKHTPPPWHEQVIDLEGESAAIASLMLNKDMKGCIAQWFEKELVPFGAAKHVEGRFASHTATYFLAGAPPEFGSRPFQLEIK